MRSSITEKTKNQGFTLIENLVTIIVLAIGLLGLASLQGQGLSLTTDSYARTQASMLAFDIIERIRSNAAELSAYGGVPASSCDQLAVSAVNDLTCWQQSIAVALGSDGSGTITIDTAVPSVVGQYVRELLPYLREHVEVDLYVAVGREGDEVDGRPTPTSSRRR